MTSVPVPPAVLAELARTRPTPGCTTALRAALHSRRLLLLKSLLVRLARMSDVTPGARREFAADWALLERAERTDAAAVRDVVDYPMTGSWLAAALGAPEGPAFERHLAHFRGVAVAAAVRAGCVDGDTRTVRTGVLSLPGLGVLRCPTGRVRISGRAGLVRIADAAGRDHVVLAPRAAPAEPRAPRRPGGGSGWSALRALPGSAVVLDDLDPYRVPPHGIGPGALPAAGRPHSAERAWAQRWREAQALLTATDPGRAAETRTVLRAVVPLDPPTCDGVPMSATLRAAPGAVLAQLPAEAPELTESLVHEAHHTKLAALQEVLPLCRPETGALHRVGWRPDPRPVPGVLQGVYAHLALTDLWSRAATGPGMPAAWRRRADERFETYRGEVGEGLSILRESDELTSAGREFVGEMGRRHAHLGKAAARHSR
ncbi:aKG-HExxH-type peptide beta-hydroxylase [Streptomyces sp. CRN 30]|uniref:aKG-HExxH-type peptide beta-hydroxylase n=1 Tax=Streptomyces sp. CRN 30 TaxID=3075613 RepID=UPI002A83DC24|nr:HEXXH motif-containing putative peptide modification protein [Streptomyces sp. CRN 30]